MNQALDLKFLKFLRTTSIIEGISAIILFCVAMPMKYIFDIPEAVQIVGMGHGILYLFLCLIAVIAIKKVPISPILGFGLILAAVIPFGPFIYDAYLKPEKIIENQDN